MHILNWLFLLIIGVALWYMGLLRPTGLAGRTHAEEEEERKQDAAAKWLRKDGGQHDKAR